jgi:hypothetical protein
MLSFSKFDRAQDITKLVAVQVLGSSTTRQHCSRVLELAVPDTRECCRFISQDVGGSVAVEVCADERPSVFGPHGPTNKLEIGRSTVDVTVVRYAIAITVPIERDLVDIVDPVQVAIDGRGQTTKREERGDSHGDYPCQGQIAGPTRPYSGNPNTENCRFLSISGERVSTRKK